jgi:hypothetical protein
VPDLRELHDAREFGDEITRMLLERVYRMGYQDREAGVRAVLQRLVDEAGFEPERARGYLTQHLLNFFRLTERIMNLLDTMEPVERSTPAEDHHDESQHETAGHR